MAVSFILNYMDTPKSSNNEPILDPSHELPPPHDMELTPPHDMLLKPHITHRHTWLHWLPALFGLFLGIFIGMFITQTAPENRDQINRYFVVTPSPFPSSTPTISTVPSVTISVTEPVVFCPADIKQCPDGTFIVRDGPSCEFLPCVKSQN